jgi:non-canonical purine NTP pyrophosphatase (RdgB/HAM1 family)
MAANYFKNKRGEKILFVTGNKGKLAEFGALIGKTVDNIEIDLPEPQEINVEAVVKGKLEAAVNGANGGPIMIEDTGLYMLSAKTPSGQVEFTVPYPGALIKWHMKALGLEGLTRMHGDSRAIATCCIGYKDGSVVKVFKGEIHGRIALKPAGDNGFGWDKVFIPGGHNKTFAEMSSDQKNKVSMRALAVADLVKYINN